MFKSLENLLFGSIAMTGFAAAALMVASILSGPRPASAAGAPLRGKPASTAARDAPRVNVTPHGVSGPVPAAAAWPFESSDGASRGNPGRIRPDRLSASDRWTDDSADRAAR